MPEKAKNGMKFLQPIVQYQGYCKLQINILSKFLLVKPINEDFTDIAATFDWIFIKQKNVIFVFAKHESQDFTLIFNSEEKCIEVLNAIFKKRDKDLVDKALIQERFLILIFKKIPKNGPSRLKELMRRWIRMHDETEKNEYFQLLKKHQNENQEMNDDKCVKKENICKAGITRKRKHHQTEGKRKTTNVENNFVHDILDYNRLTGGNNSIELSTERSNIYPTDESAVIKDESKFKIVNAKNQRRKLLIFSSVDKTHCYEYIFYPKRNIFDHCCNTQKKVKAVLVLDENGKNCIKYENKPHACSPILYDPEKYIELKIVKKPDYEILENCSTQSKRMLIIFDPNDRSQCYEYYWRSNVKKFQCCGCAKKDRNVLAEICHENTEKEYIRLLSDEHVCEIRNYNPEKLNQTKKCVLLPNFEIQTKSINGGERKKSLIIFDENDREKCYSYYFSVRTSVFHCNGCRHEQKTVTAKLCQNSDGEEYVLLSNLGHACAPKEYIPEQKEIILRPPAIKFMEANDKFTSKLFIFDSNTPKLCYTFTQPKDNSERYFCYGCSKKLQKKENKMVNVYLYKDDGEYYVKMLDGQKHICKPQKYEPERYERKILKPKDDYVLFRNNDKDTLRIFFCSTSQIFSI